jgi:hypothetical protein
MIPSRTELNSPTSLFHLEHPAAHFPEQHDQRVGDGRTQPVTTDLFSTTTPDRKHPSPSVSTPVLHRVAGRPRHVLPRDLPSAIKHLDDQELDRLIAAVLAEQKRRCKPVVAESTPVRKQRLKLVGVPLTTGKLNAVRAAFKAGVKPTLIARQFGLSDADVRSALASDERKR